MASICFNILVLLLFVKIHCAEIEITTKLGRIRGNIQKMKRSNSSVYEYLGIQYGIAPINELRFRQCQLNESWILNKTYPATEFGAACIQNGAYGDNFPNMDENCLFLNIYSPTTQKTANLPVMFWIHGGGFVAGDSSWFEYNPINFIEESGSNVIVVTINYRLGPLGFLASKQLYSEDDTWKSYGGLNGIYDQIQALNWTQKYISDFGGNPNNVTIFGVSAGGLSVCMLAISPFINNLNLFHQGIIESGPCVGPWGPTETDISIQISNERLLRSGYSTNITKLREVNATTFVLDLLGNGSSWIAGIDQLILTEQPLFTYSEAAKRTLNVNKLIIGFNSLDGINGWPFYVGSAPKNPTELNQFLSAYISDKQQISLLENYYYPLSSFPAEYQNNSNATIAWFAINGDVCVVCPSTFQAELLQNANKSRVETYVYDFQGPSYPFLAGHGSEQPFVFDHSNETTHYDIEWSQLLSNQMMSAWTNYGINGIPNVNNPEFIEWKSWGDKEYNVMIFDNNPHSESQFLSKYRNNVCDFWYVKIGPAIMEQICGDLKSPTGKQ